eukprot:2706669-Rhodomonas_salina.1
MVRRGRGRRAVLCLVAHALSVERWREEEGERGRGGERGPGRWGRRQGRRRCSAAAPAQSSACSAQHATRQRARSERARESVDQRRRSPHRRGQAGRGWGPARTRGGREGEGGSGWDPVSYTHLRAHETEADL